jgi:hypothetical protein
LWHVYVYPKTRGRSCIWQFCCISADFGLSSNCVCNGVPALSKLFWHCF